MVLSRRWTCCRTQAIDDQIAALSNTGPRLGGLCVESTGDSKPTASVGSRGAPLGPALARTADGWDDLFPAIAIGVGVTRDDYRQVRQLW